MAEYERLEAALAALDGAVVSPASRPEKLPKPPAGETDGQSATSTTSSRSRRRPYRSAATGTRAARGANRAAVLRVIDERPGVSLSELATASGVQRATLYSLLRALTEKGELAKQDLPGGHTGYTRSAPVSAAGDDAPALGKTKPTELGEKPPLN